MEIRHFYHIWCGGAWAPAVEEHARALAEAAFPVLPTVGLVGEEADRYHARGWLAQHGWPATVEADQGFEQVTLAALHDWAQNCHEPAAVLYCHTKGARNDPGGLNSTWRQAMTSRVVGDWRACLALLERHDAVGCCWKTALEFPHLVDMAAAGTAGIFAGNFWWATAAYLARLPPPRTSDRHDAERWLGLAGPDVVDLLPGWPLFTPDGIYRPASLQVSGVSAPAG